jgi:methionyl-tRNA synthetase
MIHAPLFGNDTEENVTDPNALKAMQALKDSLLTILVENSSLTKAKLLKIMNAETWFSAKESKELGLTDTIITSKRQPTAMQSTNSEDVLQFINNTINLIKKENKMSIVTNYLKLQDEASEESILNAVKSFETKIDTFENSLVSANAEIVDLKSAKTKAEKEKESLITINEELINQISEFKNEKAELIVNSAIDAGKFDNSKKEELLETAKKDIDGFQKLVDLIEIKKVSAKITDVIDNSKKDVENRKDWDYKKWSQEDPEGLKNMMSVDSEKFEKLLNEYSK